MLIECERCGAPLDVPDSAASGIVRCQYCGQQTRVLPPQRPMQPPGPWGAQPPAPWARPPGMPHGPIGYPQPLCVPQVVIRQPKSLGCGPAVSIGLAVVGVMVAMGV